MGLLKELFLLKCGVHMASKLCRSETIYESHVDSSRFLGGNEWEINVTNKCNAIHN